MLMQGNKWRSDQNLFNILSLPWGTAIFILWCPVLPTTTPTYPFSPSEAFHRIVISTKLLLVCNLQEISSRTWKDWDYTPTSFISLCFFCSVCVTLGHWDWIAIDRSFPRTVNWHICTSLGPDHQPSEQWKWCCPLFGLLICDGEGAVPRGRHGVRWNWLNTELLVEMTCSMCMLTVLPLLLLSLSLGYENGDSAI